MKQGRWAELYKAQASGRILGEDHFIERVLNETEESTGKKIILDDIVAAVCSIFDIHEDELVAPGHKQKLGRIRGVIGLLVQGIGDATLTAVAKQFGRDLSSISRNAAMVRRFIKEDQAFRQRYTEAGRFARLQA